MSVIQPNDKQTILVEDFITLAKAHLLTIQGQAITQTTYSTAAGAILPGSCFWNGYSVIDILDNYFIFIKSTKIINNENLKYEVIKLLCKYITIFHNIHEDEIELALFTNNLVQLFS